MSNIDPDLILLNRLVNKTHYIFKISYNENRKRIIQLIYRAFRETHNTFKIFDLLYFVKKDNNTVQICYDVDDTGPVKRYILTFNLDKIKEAYKESKNHTPMFSKYMIVNLNNCDGNKYIFVIPKFLLFKNKKYEEYEVTNMIENMVLE